MRLLLWRHGRTTWNDVGRFQGQADPPLDEVGTGQARLAGPVIAAMEPEVVVTSDLRRCTETAEVLGLPRRVDARLREIALGEWSGLTAAEAARSFPDEDAAWRRGEDIRRGGGETYAEVAARASAVLDDLLAEGLPAHRDGLLVFVLHGGTARALIGRLLGLPHAAWWRFGPLGNCRWSLLRQHGSEFRLVEHNVGVLAAPAQAADVGAPVAASTAGGADGASAQAALPERGTLTTPTAPATPTAPDVEPVHSHQS